MSPLETSSPKAGAAARRWTAGFVLLVAAVGAVGLVASKNARAARVLSGAGRRWHEMHTPGGGRERIVEPDVLSLVKAMREAGISTYRFTPALGDEIKISPFVVEASWPIEFRLEDQNVAGFTEELASRSDCVVVARAGKLSLARCHL